MKQRIENIEYLYEESGNIYRVEEDEAQFILVKGGDGSVLHATRKARELGVPIVGCNTGTLGFLSNDVTESQLHDMLASRNYITEERLLLDIEYGDSKYLALNEVAVVGQHTGKLVENTVYARFDDDNQYITTYKGDALLVSSPTGSTAYNISAGGPILHPSCRNIILTPVAPFSLSNRPLVLPGKIGVDINIEKGQKIVIDGYKHIDGDEIDFISVKLSDESVKLIRPKDHDFFLSIREKLGWANSIK